MKKNNIHLYKIGFFLTTAAITFGSLDRTGVINHVDSINQKGIVKDNNISFSELKSILKSNNNLSDSEKEIINSYIDYLEKYYKDVNYEKFAYNLKNIKIEYTKSVEHIEGDIEKVAIYDPFYNVITVANKCKNDKTTLFHELTHACTECRYYGHNISSSGFLYGDGVLEMLTQYYCSRDFESDSGYLWMMPYAEALVALTDFSFDDFCNGGIYLLKERLEEKKLDANKIINFLDELKTNRNVIKNKNELETKYGKKYSSNLRETCYDKIISDYDATKNGNIVDYLCSIKSKLPGRATDFDNYMISKSPKYGVSMDLSRKILLRYITELVTVKLGLAYKNGKCHIDDYTIINVPAYYERGEEKDSYALVLTNNHEKIIDGSKEILYQYEDYINHTEKYRDITHLSSLNYEKNNVTIDFCSSLLDKLEQKIKKNYIESNNLKSNKIKISFNGLDLYVIDGKKIIKIDNDEIKKEYTFYYDIINKMKDSNNEILNRDFTDKKQR